MAHPEGGVNACKPYEKPRFTFDLRCLHTPLTGTGHSSVIRRFAIALLLLGAFAAPAQARPKPSAEVSGIIVRVDQRAIVVRALDGSTERVNLTGRAAVSLDGKRATLSALRPGDVVIVMRRGRGAAIEIRAFSP